MKFKRIPIFWLKTLAEGNADELFYQYGISDAEEILEAKNFSKLRKHLKDKDKRLAIKELKLIKNTNYLGNYLSNNLYPVELKYEIDENNLEKAFKIYSLFFQKEWVMFNIEQVNNETFFQIASVEHKAHENKKNSKKDIKENKVNLINSLTIYSISIDIIENFFEGEASPDLDNKKNHLLVSLIKAESLKNSIIIPLLNKLYIKNIYSPTKRIKKALDFFQYTDRVIHLQDQNKFLELKKILRTIIISNELYDLKFSTLFKILADYKDLLKDFEINHLVFVNRPEDPEAQKNFTFFYYLDGIDKKSIESLLLTFGSNWFSKAPQEEFLKLLPMKVIFYTALLSILDKLKKMEV